MYVYIVYTKQQIINIYYIHLIRFKISTLSSRKQILSTASFLQTKKAK